MISSNKYPREFSINAIVRKVQRPTQSNTLNNNKEVLITLLDAKKDNKPQSHHSALLAEAIGSKWLTLSVPNNTDSLKEGDIFTSTVILNEENNVCTPSNFTPTAVKNTKLNLLNSFINDVIGTKNFGDPATKDIFKLFGDELFAIAISDKNGFLKKGVESGLGLPPMVRFINEAPKYQAMMEGYSALIANSIEQNSAKRLVISYQEKLLNHLHDSPWYFCRGHDLKVKFSGQGRSYGSVKAVVNAIDNVSNMLNGVQRTPQQENNRAYWIFSSLIYESHLDGHTAINKDQLIDNAYSLGFFDYETASKLLERTLSYGSLIQTESLSNGLIISDRRDYEIERAIIQEIKERMSLTNSTHVDESRLFFEDYLTKEQRSASLQIIQNKLLVVSGGAGTGKTTTVKSLISNVKSHDYLKNEDIVLLAPTGKAKDRLAEATGLEAETIHMMIARQHHKDGSLNQTKVNKKLFIIDEAGMVDSLLFLNLLQVIPKEAKIVLVGDIKQLFPVKHGHPFGDMLKTNFVPSLVLTKPQRTSAESEIHQVATLVAEGITPMLEGYNNEVSFQSAKDDKVIHSKLISELKSRKNLDDTIVIVPMNVGNIGVKKLNKDLKKVFNPMPEGNDVTVRTKFGESTTFNVNDRVMITENNKYLKVSNGDVGTISSITNDNNIVVKLRDRDVIFKPNTQKSLVHAFCLSIHKTQGSEYGDVIMPLSMSQKRMLSPELVYTGITRAKEKLTVIGDADAIDYACNFDNKQARVTYMHAELEKLADERSKALNNESTGIMFKELESPQDGIIGADYKPVEKNQTRQEAKPIKDVDAEFEQFSNFSF
ncbi:AAA family ATPase [Pseudoalteromonas sp. OFAV1]|uniref:ATP-dependent DNA helicase n=1 Tax=Pseudoalteromonas sp. OFAV1 TaxID=2908892 RepID=UPI001F18FB4F|nr:AAA family ATPase [Pseudoalteromonas sp. OFAV1]MCF2900953.1 AAA family ATPase [Pseudoalteromonas sp. OFAV1]